MLAQPLTTDVKTGEKGPFLQMLSVVAINSLKPIRHVGRFWNYCRIANGSRLAIVRKSHGLRQARESELEFSL